MPAAGKKTKSLALPVREILTTGGTQTRVALSDATIRHYAEQMTEGERFPPPVVFQDKTRRLWLADGFHRLAAHKRAFGDQGKITCVVHEGSKLDAILHACGANAEHGLPRSNADKRNIVTVMLSQRTWADRSDNWIAQTARVSNHLVATVRSDVAQHLELAQSREGRDGRAIDTTSIGKRLPAGGLPAVDVAKLAPAPPLPAPEPPPIRPRQPMGPKAGGHEPESDTVSDIEQDSATSFPAILEALGVVTIAEALTKITTTAQQMRRLERKVKEVEQERDMLLNDTMIGELLDVLGVQSMSEALGAIRAMTKRRGAT